MHSLAVFSLKDGLTTNLAPEILAVASSSTVPAPMSIQDFGLGYFFTKNQKAQDASSLKHS
ncbi:hypothetical protein AYP82_08090 [Lactobacillus crispatus]|uniref:Uncharacterized protein n=1 Tax=Lactobacillus crispatus TaxID=47770 RepID=A0A854PP08_9LACO|nr:hypothetical protein AYP81_09005 [Lactobacillus crispatus]OXC23005.1 hypothetical protein AYP82_08090 [Lactobacillus crispatus]